MQDSISGIFFKKKVITTYCPICSFTKTTKIKITKDDKDLETTERLNKKVSKRINAREGGWER